MDEKKRLELADDRLKEASGGCDDHDSSHYAAAPPCGRCCRYMQAGKTCPSRGASKEEQPGGF